MLDDLNVIKQRDPADALGVAVAQPAQATFETTIENANHDGREIKNIVVAGMGGSALAALIAKAWLKSRIPISIEVCRTYTLPEYVGVNTLVIASSYSGNTEETVACLRMAQEHGAQIGVTAAGGKLIEIAEASGISFVRMPAGLQPRMAMIYNLRTLVELWAHFDVVDRSVFDEIAAASEWLSSEVQNWVATVDTHENIAKQLALMAVGKTPIFYAGSLMAPVAYKWKISWNENAKNVAFWNEYPEFNHNEFIGWASHPVEKPFAVFDLVSQFEHAQILKRFDITDRLLSGKRPKAITVDLVGDTPIAQMLWASILADFVSIYVAILNGVDPTPVDLVEKLKKEL